MTDTNLIMNLPVLPVKRTVLFPGVLIPLTVGRDRSVAAVEAALKTEDKTILVVAQRDPHTEEPGLDDLYTIGTKAVIKQTARGAEGQLNILIQGLERFVLLRLEQTTPYLLARTRHLPAPSAGTGRSPSPGWQAAPRPADRPASSPPKLADERSVIATACDPGSNQTASGTRECATTFSRCIVSTSEVNAIAKFSKRVGWTWKFRDWVTIGVNCSVRSGNDKHFVLRPDVSTSSI